MLAREDPRETFLKNLPAKASPVEVTYPVSGGWLGRSAAWGGAGSLGVLVLDMICQSAKGPKGKADQTPPASLRQTAFREKLVRRRLRHVCADGRRRHTTRLLWWVLALVPQVRWAGGGYRFRRF